MQRDHLGILIALNDGQVSAEWVRRFQWAFGRSDEVERCAAPIHPATKGYGLLVRRPPTIEHRLDHDDQAGALCEGSPAGLKAVSTVSKPAQEYEKRLC